MRIATTAKAWFLSNYSSDKNKIYTSRYYTPENSWPKTHVWWLQIPLKAIDKQKYDYVNLICQAAPNENKFYYLKVPTKYLHKHLEKFHRLKGKISLYLSANPKTLFIEERGNGSLDFSGFVVRI